MAEPLAYIGAARAVQLTQDQCGISAAAAIEMLGEAIDCGEIEPDWRDGRPPAACAAELDWRDGVLRRRLRLQDRAITEDGELPVWRDHLRTWPFRLRRDDVEALIADRIGGPQGSAAAPAAAPAGTGPVQSKARQLEDRMSEYVAAHGAAALREIPVKNLGPSFGGSRTLAAEIRDKLLRRK
jgi:hypothetical protein